MKYRRLGSTGLRASAVGFGTWRFGGEWGRHFAQPEVDALLRRAKELGKGFQRFWSATKGYCFDVLDGPGGNDDALRPNQRGELL